MHLMKQTKTLWPLQEGQAVMESLVGGGSSTVRQNTTQVGTVPPVRTLIRQRRETLEDGLGAEYREGLEKEIQLVYWSCEDAESCA